MIINSAYSCPDHVLTPFRTHDLLESRPPSFPTSGGLADCNLSASRVGTPRERHGTSYQTEKTIWVWHISTTGNASQPPFPRNWSLPCRYLADHSKPCCWATTQKISEMDTLSVLALCFGLASAQVNGVVNLPTLTQSCPPALTITVLPPDYTGIFTNVAGLPTLSVPGLPILSDLPDLSLSLNLPTALPSLSLPSLSLNLPTALPSLTLPFSIPTAIPTNLLPSVTLALPTISIPVSALLPTSLLAGPTPTPVAYTCPEYDGQTIYENGLLYVLSCGAQATGDIYAATVANVTNSFNDCFTACDQFGTLLGALFCTGFSFVPDASGSGNGTCYLQNSVAQDLVFGGTGRVAAVRLLNYILGGHLLAPVLSALPTVSLTTPTGLPTIGLPPIPLSSIVNDLSSGLAGLSTAIALPTNLPISSVLNGLSSDLAGLSTAVVLPTNLPISSILNGLSSDLAGLSTAIALPTNLPISSILNGLSSDLAGLSTAIALPTNLPVSSLLNGLSSDLAGLSTAIPLPTNLPISSVLNQLSSNLAGLSTALPLPTNNPLSSVLAGLSSNLAQLTTFDPLAPLTTISIPPVVLPTLSVAVPSLSLSIPSFDLGTLVPTPTASLALPSISIPVISVATPSLNLGGATTLLNGLTTVIAIPTLSVSIPSISIPSISIPSISIPSISIPSISIPSISIPSIAIPTIAIPSISVPAISLATPSVNLGGATTLLNGLTTVVSIPTLSIPSASLPVISISVPSFTISIPSTNLLGGLSTALVLPTTNILPGLPTLFPPPVAASSAAASAASSAAASAASSAAAAASSSAAAAASSRSSTASVASSPASTAVPTATSIPVFSCPRDNGLEYLSSANQAFIVQCGTVFNGYDISQAAKPNLQSCVDSCGGISGCTGVSYSVLLGICAYKSAVGTGVASIITDSAAPLDLSCPSGNGNTYLDSLGGNYQVLCNTTFPQATVITSPVPLAKRAGANAVAPAVECSRRCTAFSGCIGVFSSTAGLCTFLSAFGNAGTGSSTIDSIVAVGKRIVAVVSGSTVTSTSRATAIPAYTTRTASAINNAPTTTTTTGTLTLPSVVVSLGVTLGVGASVGVGGLPGVGGGGAAATPTGFSTTGRITARQVTAVLPVTTIITTSSSV